MTALECSLVHLPSRPATAVPSVLETPPLALYVHFPWCVRKCPYCDFNSYAAREGFPEESYIAALGADLAAQAPAVAAREVSSIFLGGGTPSLFSPRGVGRVLEDAGRHLRLAADLEVTLEANPGTIERGRFAEYRVAGVNRVSLGAQTFDAARLAALGRIHSPLETRRAAEELHAAGIGNFNLDLMYGLPGQDADDAERDIEEALLLEPAHLSHYQLTIETGTVFAGRPPPLPDEEAVEGMLGACAERLCRAGLRRYEISGYATPGRRCRHNLNYWLFGDYLGIGAGAHGKLTQAAAGQVWRTTQPREPRRYMAGAPSGAGHRRLVPAQDLPFEFMLNALRLADGFEAALFCSRTGLAWETVRPIVEQLIGRGLMVREGHCYRPSPLGFCFLNDLLMAFLPETSKTID